MISQFGAAVALYLLGFHHQLIQLRQLLMYKPSHCIHPINKYDIIEIHFIPIQKNKSTKEK